MTTDMKTDIRSSFEREPRPGSLRYKRAGSDEYVVVEPGDPLFSTATFLATEYWDGGAWKSTFLAEAREDGDA